jgi:hypothetical protein
MNDENKPLSYADWLAKNGLSATDDYYQYSNYLKEWYNQKKLPTSNLRNEYVQLLKEINYVFGDEKRDRFLSQIDFNNREDLINSLPYFTTKIKELAKSFNEKRRALKDSKLKYNLTSSNRGIEKLLYEYILRSFTSKDKIAPVPYKELTGLVPELKNVNSLFYIEIEELYDKSNYFDQSPKSNIEDFVNTNNLLNTFPYKGKINRNQLLGLLSTSVKERGANDPLSKFYQEFLNLNADIEDDITEYEYLNALNTIALNEKYMGNDLFGLTAIKTETELTSDFTTVLDIQQGNNWFFWPSGDKVYSVQNIDNIYYPIEINNSNLISNGATGGGSFKESDIILTDKKGYVEGAWLMGPRTEYSEKNVSFTVDPNENRRFIWPYTGFNLTKNTNQWRGFLTNDDSNKFFYFLSDREKSIILNNYHTLPLPSLSSDNIYLNQTNFYKQGAYSDKTALDSDVIIKQKHIAGTFPSYNDLIGKTEVAFLYKFEETEIPITDGFNSIVWPLMKIENDIKNIPITITNDFCDPVELKTLDVEECFRGAVAGRTMEESDIIYKLDKRSGKPIEAAWLKNISINDLNVFENEIPIYKTKATCCEKYTDGPNQSGLYTVIESGQRVSFIWCGEDTVADEVFSYSSHQTNCEYDDKKRDYYINQDYSNPTPITDNVDFWNLCTCKSVLYSPIGHKGNSVIDYDGMCDLLYADPQGLVEDFDFSTWQDTRCLDYKSSPQFSFFKLDSLNLNLVGFGSGSWKTSTGSKMILKTGRRYTYFRSHLKKVDNTGPKFVISYDYKKQKANCLSSQSYDIVLCVDISQSQKYNLDTTKKIVESIVSNVSDNVQIGIIAFDSRQIRASYLSTLPDLVSFLNILEDYNENNEFTYRTNIYEAVKLAYYLLTTEITDNNKKSVLNLNKLCSDVNATIVNAQRVPVYNQPRPDAIKRIIIISDGNETSELAKDGSGKLLLPSYIDEITGKIDLIASLNTFSDLSNITDASKNDAYYIDDINTLYKWNGSNWITTKESTVQIQSIDLGALSVLNNVMENISTKGLYFNLQKYLNANDIDDVERIVKDIVYRISQCGDVRSRWMKMIRNGNGDFISTEEESDIILRPNDNIAYIHKSEINYSSPVNEYVSFATPSKNFIIKIPLRGWDYLTNKYVKDDIVVYKGARPFWGKAYVDEDKDNNFNKELIYMGGHVRWLDYLPIKQPEVSDMILQHSDYIEYVRRRTERVKFSHTVPFKENKTNYQWNKLEFSKQYSNLSKLFKNDSLEYIAKGIFEKSDLLLEETYEFKPAKYNYFARNSFSFNQDLFLLYKCNPTYSQLLSGKVLEAKNPYAHLDNVNFPTIAVVPYTNNFVSKKQTGHYLLPTKLGVPFFAGIGYNIQIDEAKVYELEQKGIEPIFLDPEKYGPITRGLSNVDNLSPTKITSIDNRWMMIPYGSGEVSGIITNTKNTQKFTPYQSEYEILGINQYGVSRPTDQFQFYDQNRAWNSGGLNFRGEVSKEIYLDRRKKYLVDLGIVTSWKMDLYGNNYSLFKSKLDSRFIELDENYLKVNYNDIEYDKTRLSTDDYPINQQNPENYENITYDDKEQDYLEFLQEFE